MTDIPKVIHYCWFGRKDLPADVQRNIASWQRFFPDYEIRQWNETNFDVNCIPYTEQAYSVGKFAFVSDYARMWVLYHHGGIYFDTDVEVIAPFDDILAKGGFAGFETPQWVNPGQGIALPRGSRIAGEVMTEFERTQFLKPDGGFNPQGIVPITTRVLLRHGLHIDGRMQRVGEELTVYPADWFNPLDAPTERLHKTSNTRSIHWYMKSWMKPQSRLRRFLARWYHRILKQSFLSHR